MTFEELKREAMEQGYKLVKIAPPKAKLQPCVCGRKRIDIWQCSMPTEYRASCPKCARGEDNEWSKTEREARNLWNSYIEDMRGKE